MEKHKIASNNEIAKKQRTIGLTEDEKAELHELRQEYLSSIRQNFRQTLESIEFKD